MSSSLAPEIFDTLHDMLHIFRAHMRQSLESSDSGLTFGELRVLIYVGQHPDCKQKTLVQYSRTDKAQMARTIARLNDRGWLVQTQSAHDRRVRQLHLSAQGQELFKEFSKQRALLATRLLKDCPQPMQSQLLELLVLARESARAADTS